MFEASENINSEDSKDLFFSLGIAPEIVPADIDYAQAYKVLQRFVTAFTLPLQIQEPWQLQFFCPDAVLDLAALQDKRDNWGSHIGHYAGCSGYVDGLNWIQTNAPTLLQNKNNYGNNIAHFAARCGHTAVLDWIQTNAPTLLQEKTAGGSNIAHCAALYGHTAVLDWILLNTPDLLPEKKYYTERSFIMQSCLVMKQP